MGRGMLRICGSALMVLGAAWMTGLVLAGESACDRGWIVHEWGTFTSVAGADGAALEWRPLAGPSDLPSFVYTTTRLTDDAGRGPGLRYGANRCRNCDHLHCACGSGCDGQCKCKGCLVATVRMETPVLYFYSDCERVVSVRVGFPQGQVTEWYPRARWVRDGIDWGAVRILPGADPAFPREEGESHYYPARNTDASPVRSCMAEGWQGDPEYEKFLFYRGVGTFDLPVEAGLQEQTVRVQASGVRHLVVFERRADGAAGVVSPLRSDNPATMLVPRPVCGDPDEAIRRAEELLRDALLAEGLYAREVEAMLATWRDSWFEEGLRVFYTLPRSETDAILPLEIDPAPAETVRVLVGRIEIVTPEREREILEAVVRLGSDESGVRETAGAALRRHGRFAEPTLRRALEGATDPEVRSRLEAVLQARE